jgi:hypothetical protein
MGLGMYAKLYQDDDILPCPFCGAPAGYLVPNSHSVRSWDRFVIRCSNTSYCDVRTPEFVELAVAKSVWNRRTSNAASAVQAIDVDDTNSVLDAIRDDDYSPG